MINRELIRIKVVQLTYAYYQNGSKNIETAEKELFYSLSKAYDLSIYLLALIVGITKEARRHLEVAQAKAQREGGAAPSQKFVYNRFALQLESNKMLNDFLESQKRNWDDDPEFLKKIYTQITESQIYKDYMDADDDDYQTDREVWRKLYRALIQDNADLDALLEEKSLYWNDDKEIVDTFVLKTIKRFDEAKGDEQELLPEFRDYEDREFAVTLIRKAIENCQYYQLLISKSVKNWEFNRLAYMDVIIMQMALAEILSFPEIPITVSINEYVELAKCYSTPKSHAYINGILDNIAKRLIKEHKLIKK
jgi:N utilization substance protein B